MFNCSGMMIWMQEKSSLLMYLFRPTNKTYFSGSTPQPILPSYHRHALARFACFFTRLTPHHSGTNSSKRYMQNESTDEKEIAGASLSTSISLPFNPYTDAESLSPSTPDMLFCSAWAPCSVFRSSEAAGYQKPLPLKPREPLLAGSPSQAIFRRILALYLTKRFQNKISPNRVSATEFFTIKPLTTRLVGFRASIRR